MEVSYVITAYNTEKYIEECIDSILSQRHHEQIIVINDGSTDKTGELIEKYVELGITFIDHKERKGCCYSRMEGMRLCQADYMTFIDSDDYYLKNLPVPLFSGPDIIDFGMEGAFNNHEEPTKIMSSGETVYVDEEIWDAYRKTYINEILVNKLISKRVYKKVCENLDIDDLPNYCDNFAIMSCYAFYAKSYKKVDDVFYYYRQGTGMNTYLPKLERFKQFCSQKEVVNRLVKLGMPEDTLIKEVISRAKDYIKWFDSLMEFQEKENAYAIAYEKTPRNIKDLYNINVGDNIIAKELYYKTFKEEYKED